MRATPNAAPPAPGPALLVIDMQNALVAMAYRASATVAAIAGLQERARAAGAPVVFAQQRDDELEPGTEGWRIVPELAPAPGETVVPKAAPDSFLDTELDAALSARGVTELVVTGFATEICVESTARQALSRGYDVVLVADGHTTSVRPGPGPYAAPEASVAHHNEIYRNLRYPGRRVRVLPAAEVDFGGRSPGDGSARAR
ncbi:cysteine hydrolase family protein [Streptomyces griseus]|uniref:cysteine hydrolase family protein n=1 Tax=Streptomyces TaxID=1883 RepID=UPI0001C188AA|nr:cysteine hydrolase family protein [Streptomyces sp. ACT-1]EGE44051.1 isochorismatase hydrolase [Streptomyces sp. ACT-1]MYR52082.1 isochorismatase family protein [Streptomyces sp. SID4928]NEB56875.1 cysteine hydrolase [Streptomyces griseus]